MLYVLYMYIHVHVHMSLLRMPTCSQYKFVNWVCENYSTQSIFLCRTDNTRGISALILFPGSGHLFLTAGMDAGIRVSSSNTVLNPCNHIYLTR